MRYAIVKDNTVVNMIEYKHQPTTPPPGFEDGHTAIQADHVSPGWIYENNQFINPNPVSYSEFLSPPDEEQA